MIASGILFACLFAVLALLSNCLQSARLLRQSNVDIGMLAAELSLTNRLMEGPINGDFSDQYPDYFWDGEITEVSTNGLFQVEFNIHRRGSNRASDGNLSILLFRPESQRGRFPPRRF